MSAGFLQCHRLLKSAVIQTKNYFWIIDQEILDSARILRQEMIFDFDSRGHTLNLSISVNFHSLTPRFCRELDQHPNYPYITSNVAQSKSGALLRPSTKIKGKKLGISVRHLCAKKITYACLTGLCQSTCTAGNPTRSTWGPDHTNAMQVSKLLVPPQVLFNFVLQTLL